MLRQYRVAGTTGTRMGEASSVLSLGPSRAKRPVTHTWLGLGRVPYVVYGVNYIDLASLAGITARKKASDAHLAWLEPRALCVAWG